MWTTYPPASPYDLSWGSYGSSRVFVGNATEDARDVMRLIDDTAIYFPVTALALSLQASIFKWAELFGIKDQVEYIVYALRVAGGVGGAVAAAGSGAAVSAGVSAVGGLAAALPAVGAVVAVVLFITGGSDDEALQEKRRKDAQAKINHLRDRLTLAQFAAEQRAAAVTTRLYAQNPVTIALSGQGSAAELEKQASVADRVALLYDKAQKELPAAERALFESTSNLARWRGVLESYSKLNQTEQDNFDVIGFGKTAPRLPSQIKPKITAEEKKISNLALEASASGAPGTTLLLGLAALAGAGAYVAIDPAGALANAKRALPFAGGAVKTGARAVSSVGSFVWKRIPKGK